MCKVKNKERSIGLFKHVLVHLALTSIAIVLSGISLDYKALIALIVIISSHYIIDVWKTYRVFVLKYFLIDQVGHLILLAVYRFG